ncbi:sulfurtransferase [Pseudotenacibaculum sp. MALMAid0570]|uniref:sulfurtransferase n=1 Tax=Pseudotenacibaculum sp. MALMAid0570 TaxID=3143938 RepID=UPI0032DF68CB
MNCKRIFFILVLVFVSCTNEESQKLTLSKGYLIEFEEFKKIASHKNVKLLDFRKPEFYKESHIEGALNIWRTDLENKTYPYKGMMAEKEQVEKLFGSLGINNEDIIVVYDDNGLCDSSRLWWLLQVYGYNKIKMLHGGFSLWKEENEVTTKVPEKSVGEFVFKKPSSFETHATKEEVLAALYQKKLILDTRTHNEFSGKRQKKGAVKAGRIPDSKLIDWASAINFNGDKKIKSVAELKEIYKDLLPYKNDTIIVYCQSGFRSSHTTFVLKEILGFKHVKNYDGAWVEWSYFNDLPFEKDSITTIFE